MKAFRSLHKSGILSVVILVASSISVSAFEQSNFPFQERIFSVSYTGGYASQATVKKNDVFITGDQVTISSSILSNGGDVVIIANDVLIAAPIDTRVYLNHGEYFAQAPQCESQSVSLRNLPNAISAYNDYYLKTLVWDASRKWWQFGLMTTFAEMPQGRTPPHCRGIANGTDAPTEPILRANTRSGSITIVASTIRFCDDCPDAREMNYNPISVPSYPSRAQSDDTSPMFPECHEFGGGRPLRPASTDSLVAESLVRLIEVPFKLDRIRTDMLLVTSGMEAGRGGVGQTDGCVFPGNARFRCTIDIFGGRSGSAGESGPSGNIRLVLVNQAGNSSGYRGSDYYEAFASYRSPKVRKHFLITPGFDRLQRIANRCVFQTIGLSTETDGREHGMLDVIHADTATALEIAGAALARIDARVERDYASLVSNDATVLRGMTPSEHFTLFLLKTVLRMQNHLLLNASNTTNATSPTVDKIFQGLSIGARFGPSLRNEQQELLRKVAQLANLHVEQPRNGLQLVARYLVNADGLFELTGQDVSAQSASLELGFELNLIRQKIVELATEIGSLRIDLQEYFSAGREQELASVVSELRGQVSNIEQRIKSQNEDQGFAEFAKWYGELAKRAHDGIIKPYETGDAASSFRDMLSAAKDIYTQITEFGKKDHTLYEQAERLREDAEAASKSLMSYLRYVETERDSILQTRFSRLRELWNAKRSLLKKQSQRITLLDEALRQSLVHYLIQKTPAQWSTNLNALAQFTDLDSPAQIVLSAQTRRMSCTDADTVDDSNLRDTTATVQCIRVAARGQELLIYVFAGNELGRIPVAHLLPNQTPKTIATFGAFRGRDYQLIERQ
ncbi:hypothetical protein [Bradyrhizobium sp. AUGA SZCCT0431]|uniref:hypothetical protein n=1 Tax=Bradyrhizobium sp. AUGA SZCCT0431 TaxID=2807674 RepID=UPI001BA84EFD|nr:hypothetical protein [Bradyrhizobium sp. AUGA SZCCT0431]MBR1147507.1 hypothetical protein [Bradyrhizobium sp. AUGA SZCCT0431]